MNEEEIKEKIEKVGYKEFYRYYKEKDEYICFLKKQLSTIQNDLEILIDNWKQPAQKDEYITIKIHTNELRHILDIVNETIKYEV